MVLPHLAFIWMMWDAVFRTGIELQITDATITPCGFAGRNGNAANAISAVRHLFLTLVFIALSLAAFAGSASDAAAETRTLKIHFVHTGEKASITFKRNGRYDASGLKQLNYILRDWRRNEPTKMNPRLFDLVWQVYRQAGASGYINVVSGYRSPETNSMLRKRSKGVAKESQHMRGTAMDFYIPGVPLKTLREVGMKMQAGGVGYYPNSGSPFVHMDVASVRAWPRMSRNELVRLFPNGKTLHIPSDGRPLPGYQQAMAEYKQRLNTNDIIVADNKPSGKRKNLLAFLFGTGDEDEEEDVVVPSERPATRQQPVLTNSPPVMMASAAPPPGVETAAAPAVEAASAEAAPTTVGNAPVPLSRPSLRPQVGDTSLAVALYSPARNPAEEALSQVAAATPEGNESFADLQTYKIPVPTLLGPRGMKGDAEGEIMTASVDPAQVGAQTEDFAVPVPVGRPAVAEALLAQTDGQEEAEADEIEQAILSPEAAAALEESRQADAQAKEAPVEVAALHPQPEPSARSVDFGDVFDAPDSAKSAKSGIEAGLPAKGGRPSRADAEAARVALSGGTALTQTMLSQWAISQNKFETVAKPVKAPRVVSRALSAEPAKIYPVGFKGDAQPVDSGRFGPVTP